MIVCVPPRGVDTPARHSIQRYIDNVCNSAESGNTLDLQSYFRDAVPPTEAVSAVAHALCACCTSTTIMALAKVFGLQSSRGAQPGCSVYYITIYYNKIQFSPRGEPSSGLAQSLERAKRLDTSLFSFYSQMEFVLNRPHCFKLVLQNAFQYSQPRLYCILSRKHLLRSLTTRRPRTLLAKVEQTNAITRQKQTTTLLT